MGIKFSSTSNVNERKKMISARIVNPSIINIKIATIIENNYHCQISVSFSDFPREVRTPAK